MTKKYRYYFFVVPRKWSGGGKCWGKKSTRNREKGAISTLKGAIFSEFLIRNLLQTTIGCRRKIVDAMQ